MSDELDLISTVYRMACHLKRRVLLLSWGTGTTKIWIIAWWDLLLIAKLIGVVSVILLNVILLEYHSTECHSTGWIRLNVVPMDAIILYVILPNVTLVSVIVHNVTWLSVVLLNVRAPSKAFHVPSLLTKRYIMVECLAGHPHMLEGSMTLRLMPFHILATMSTYT